MIKLPKLVIVSERTRDHFHIPLQYFTKFEIIHLYSSKFFDSQVFTPGVKAIEYKSLMDLNRKLISLKPDYIQGLEPYYGYSRIRIPLKVIARLFIIHHFVKKYRPIFFFHVLENQTPDQKYGLFAGIIMERVFRWYGHLANFVFYANEGAKKNCLRAGINPKILSLSTWGFWGVAINLFKPGQKTKEPSIIFVGSLNRQKGIQDFINIALQLSKKIVNLQVTIIGSGTEEDLVKVTVRGNDNWFWHKLVLHKDMPQQLMNKWLMLAPSKDLPNSSEQVSLSNLEALSCGVPIVGFKSGSIEEFLPANQAVLLVEHKDIEALAEKAKKYLLDKAYNAGAQLLAREWIIKNYNTQDNIKKIEDWFFPHKPGVILAKATESIGGGEIQTVNLGEALVTQGVKVGLIISPNSPIKEIGKKLDQEDLYLGQEATNRYTIFSFWLHKSKYRRKARILLGQAYASGYRTIVCQSINEKIILSRIGHELGFKVIWLDFQLLLPWLPRNPLFSRLKTASKYVDKIVTTSEFLKEQHKTLGLGSVAVILPGIELPPKGTRKTLDQSKVTIGLVGRLHSEKGLDVFLEALKDLPESVEAKVVGTGPDEARLKDLVKQYKLEKRVHFLGFIEDTSQIYQQFDIFCQPSRRDNTPLTVLEAMAHGLPVVASRVGAIPEIIGEAGLIVSPDKPKELTQALSKIIQNKDLYQTLSERALKQALKFNIKQMAKEFYAQILA